MVGSGAPKRELGSGHPRQLLLDLDGFAVVTDELGARCIPGPILDRLAGLDPRQARVVECRFFGGMSIEETAEALGVSPATVKRGWGMAQAWLYRDLSQAVGGAQ